MNAERIHFHIIFFFVSFVFCFAYLLTFHTELCSGKEVKQKHSALSIRAHFEHSWNGLWAREDADERGKKFIYTRKQFPSDEQAEKKKINGVKVKEAQKKKIILKRAKGRQACERWHQRPVALHPRPPPVPANARARASVCMCWPGHDLFDKFKLNHKYRNAIIGLWEGRSDGKKIVVDIKANMYIHYSYIQSIAFKRHAIDHEYFVFVRRVNGLVFVLLYSYNFFFFSFSSARMRRWRTR